MSPRDRIEVFKGKGMQPYYYRLVSANNQTLSLSEGYLTHWNVVRAARKIAEGLQVELRDLTSKPYRKFGA